MENPKDDKSEIRDHLMRFRTMERETTDPLAMRFLHDIVADLEAELDRRNRPTGASYGRGYAD